MEHPFERHYERIFRTKVFTEFPIHYAGCGLFFYNESPTQARTISLQESVDGTTYTALLFSTPTLANQVSIVIQPKCFVAIMFVCSSQYLRVSLDGDCPEGVFMHMTQWMPRRTSADGGYS